MRQLTWICILAALAAPGCAARYSSVAVFSDLETGTSAQVKFTSGSPLGNAIIVGIMAGDAISYYRLGPEGRTQVRPPELDPDRKVNVQDCTRPVDASAGNLMCR
jgi:hypothetical protein